MQSNLDLIINADHPNRSAELRLLDSDGSEIIRQTDFNTIAAGHLHGLFDLRNYLRHYIEAGREAASVAEIGICIAEGVLGEEIFRKLWESESQRTLRIQLPGATEEENHLAAALARVPWEIARPSADKPTLGERNLLVRVVHDMEESATQPLNLDNNECLRVLFVFAEARGSRPLTARMERQKLRQLFEKEIYANRRVEAHFLTHGVTRERLKEQIKDNNGYHIVHWSGHGHLNLLELAKSGGAKDLLSGEKLLGLFKRAGGFIPRLFFLSACHSGDIRRVKDWNDFIAIAQGKEPDTKQTPDIETKEIPLDTQPGYTGTAHALLQGGVSSVVAMRYAVGDEYGRELSIEFYRTLLAHAQPKTVAAALTMARRSLLDMMDALPPGIQEKLKALPPEVRAALDSLPPEAQQRPDLLPLLRYLMAVGLTTEESKGPDDKNPSLYCHELVRERIRAWMDDRPQDRADLTENTICPRRITTSSACDSRLLTRLRAGATTSRLVAQLRHPLPPRA